MTKDTINETGEFQNLINREPITQCDCGSTEFHIFCEHAANATAQPDGTLVHTGFYELNYDDTVRCQKCDEEWKLGWFKDVIEKAED